MEASPPQTQSVQPVIVYALYGKANSQELALWQRTWLQGKQFVFVPDAPVGPFAHLYRPVHSGHGKMPTKAAAAARGHPARSSASRPTPIWCGPLMLQTRAIPR